MKKLNLLFLMLLAFTAITFTSCVDQDFDDLTTANVDPEITPTHTIKQVQDLVTSSIATEITTDVIFDGIVIGDDSTGNIYKQIIIQKDSSGISFQVDMTNFYTEYPVGRHIYVKCKGLYIANDGDGNFEIGNPPASPNSPVSSNNPLGRVPSALVTRYIVKGKWGQYITPKVFALNATNIPTNTLVKYNDVEFASAHAGIYYAASSPSNLTIQDCAIPPHELILYSSTYSTFAFTKTPYGKGSITGVYTVYSGDGELQIRSLKDVDMPGLRCDGSTGIPDLMQLDSIRMLDPGANVTYLPGDKKIVVTVTSNYATGMLTNTSAYVQDATAAIEIHFKYPDVHSFGVGTKLEINVSGMELSTYNGVLQINNVPLGNAISIGSGSVTPRIETINNLLTNLNAWEGQLVTINNVTITGSGIYKGTNTLSDGTGTIDLYTAFGASFANDSFPTGVVSVTGILTEYVNGAANNKEILIRSASDVHP